MRIGTSEIYICNLLDYSKQEIYEMLNMFPIIPQKVQKKISAIKNEQSKIRSIVAWLMFSFLSERYGYDTENVAIGKYGKPYLQESNVNFNISHSGQWVVIGFSNNPIGIDVEEKELENVHEVLTFISGVDRKHIFSYGSDLKKAFKFFWSAKEARGKYVGTGLKDFWGRDVLQWEKNEWNKMKQFELDNGAALSICGEDNEILSYNVKITGLGLKTLDRNSSEMMFVGMKGKRKMKKNTLLHVRTVAFSECDYFGFLKIQSCLRWFEDERFNVSIDADIQDFFMKEHRTKEKTVSLINEENEYFTMPVIENNIRCYERVPFGTKVNVHTWLEKPVGSYCTFHHYVTSIDNQMILIACQTKVTLLGEKTRLRMSMPKILEERIVGFIESIGSENEIEVEDGI